MSDKNLPKLYEGVKELTESAGKGLSSINPIAAISNVADSVMSSISNMFVKSEDCKARIVESNNDVKLEVIKGSFNLFVNATDNIDEVANICKELKEASINLAEIKADLNAHLANLDFEDKKNERKFQMWMKESDYSMIKFQKSCENIKEVLNTKIKLIGSWNEKILSIPTNTLNEEEIKFRTQLLGEINKTSESITDLLIKLMET